MFKRIFKKDKAKHELALSLLAETKKRNTSFYGKQDFENAALLTVKELDELNFAPKPQDFYTDQRAIDLVNEIYRDDFKWFKYSVGSIPQKRESKEVDLVPEDLDWQTYIKLSPDLFKHQVYNKRSVIRHYLEFGRFESVPRAYKIVAPEGFDWKKYLNLYPDLGAAGITTEVAAIEHYLSYGAREGRPI